VEELPKAQSKRMKSGGSLAETGAGLFLLIPVFLFLFDVAAMVIAQTANDSLAKHAARAAADQPTGQGSFAAQNVVNTFAAGNPTLCSKATLVSCTYANGLVSCVTQITCKLPVPVPFGGPSTQNFQATASEPVVGELAH
jgi:hypothetical protein